MPESNYDPFNNKLKHPSPELSEKWRIVDQYNTTYWSGLDIRVYFNNFRIDQATQVSYQIIEQVRPVYGYASFVADRMVQGQRLVAGEITLNFKREGYLFSLINALSSQEQWLVGSNGSTVNPLQTAATEYGLFNYNANTIQDLKNGNYKGRNLSKIVEDVYQKELLNPASDIFPAQVKNDNAMFFSKKEGFDINIIYGAQVKSELTLRYDGSGNSYPDITKNVESRLDNRPATGIKIVGAYLSSSAKTISDDGRPIMETYSFQAKNVQVLDIADLETN